MFIGVASYILRLFNRSALQYPGPTSYICLFGVLETNIQVMMTSRKVRPWSIGQVGERRRSELLRLIREPKPLQYLRARQSGLVMRLSAIFAGPDSRGRAPLTACP